MLDKVPMIVSYFYPAQNVELMEQLAKRYNSLSIFGMDCVPRISRAQKLDSLSSMANIAGYRAVVEALALYQRCPK
jgi:NAD/NADP transhydrogenase alpha subunit